MTVFAQGTTMPKTQYHSYRRKHYCSARVARDLARDRDANGRRALTAVPTSPSSRNPHEPRLYPPPCRFRLILNPSLDVVDLGAAFPHQSLAEKFAEAGAYTEYGEDDVYGVGEGLQRLERDVASHWGCEAGLFCVSGVMAQLVALCAHRETTGRNVVVLHSTSHLLLHERDAVKVLCGFDVRVAGDASRPLSAADVVADYAVLAVIVECPHRELGGAARSLADFKAMREQCESHGVILHVDGARLWEASPYYETSITVFFNSIYVSFYKGLGASAGAMLLGPDDFVARCRPWLRRFGGNLHATAPYALSRARGFRLYKDDFDDRFAKLNDIVQALREARLVGSGKRLSLVPEEPQSAMIHFVVRESRRARL